MTKSSEEEKQVKYFVMKIIITIFADVLWH